MSDSTKPTEAGKDGAPPEGAKEPTEAGGQSGSTATAKPKRGAKKAPKKRPPGMLPPWKVLLHNDDKNEITYVRATIVELTPLNQQDAEQRTDEAHRNGVSLLLVTHRERAELYKDQFESKKLVVTIEPADK